MVKIYPSMLAADFGILKQTLEEIENYADGLHIDVMDGHFVNNISFGMPVIRSIRKYSDLVFDVHLMIDNPEKYIDAFVAAGADSITFHVESVTDVLGLIDKIKSLDVKVGVSIKPMTKIPDIDILLQIDSVLVMSVEPGFGGQRYIESTDYKIQELSRIKKENNLDFDIVVDGGINFENSSHVIDCGADILIAGSIIFNSNNKIEAIKRLKVGNNE